jgi:hypothetical protein
MTRQDHQYVNLPRSLVEVVDACVSVIFNNGAQVYKSRKDFVIKSVQQQIENEKTNYHNLAREISTVDKTKKEEKIILKGVKTSRQQGGNRLKNV